MAIGTPSVVADFPTTTGGVGVTTNDCPAGNLIVVLPYCDNLNGTVTSVTDSAGNIYSKAIATTTQAGQFTASIWYAANCLHLPAGGTVHIIGVPTAIDMTVYFVTGANGGLDLTNSTVINTNVTTLSLATGTLSQADEIIIGLVAPANSPASPTASGFTQYDGAYGFYKIVAATTTQTFTPVWTGAAHASAVIATFKATAPTGSVGSIAVDIAVAGTGAALKAASGSIALDIALAAQGRALAAATGSIGLDIAVAATGRAIIPASGAISLDIGVTGIGRALAVSAGSVALNIAVSGVAAALSSSAGTIGLNLDVSGVGQSSQSGSSGSVGLNIDVLGTSAVGASSAGVITLGLDVQGVGAGGNVVVSQGGHFIPLTRKQQQALQKRLREDRKRKEEEIIERRLSDEMITQDIRDAISGPRTELVLAPTINDMDVGVEDDDSDDDLELLMLYG